MIQGIFIIPYCASFQVSVGLCRSRNKSHQEPLASEFKAVTTYHYRPGIISMASNGEKLVVALALLAKQ
jgi:hypothetical protein